MDVRRRLQVCVALCFGLILGGCGTQDLAFEVLASDSYAPGLVCTGDKPSLLVVASPSEAVALGLEHDRFADVDRLLAALDYGQQFAVAVCRGTLTVTNPSFTPEIRQVTRQRDKVVVRAHLRDLRAIAQEEGVRPAGSDPYVLAAVSKERRWEREIRFVLEIDGEEVGDLDHFIP